MLGAGASAGKIEVAIVTKYDGKDLSRFQRDVKSADRKASGLGTAAAGLGASMKGSLKAGAVGAAAAIGTGLVLALKKSITEARESERVTRQTAAVIKSTGGVANLTASQIEKLSTSLSNKTAIDDEVIQSGANLLLTFKNIRNESGKGNNIFDQTTQIMLDMSAAMGQSTKSSAIQLGKALNDPTKGMSALSRVGVTFTEGQKEQIEALQKSGDLMGAQKVILKELNSEFKGSAAAQADPIQRLNVIFNNLLETIGTALLPYINQAATALSKFFMEFMQGKGAGGDVKNMLSEIGQAIGSLLPAFKIAGQIIGWLIARFNDMPGPIKAIFLPILRIPLVIRGAVAAFNFLKNIVSTVVRAVGGFVSNLFGKVKGAFGGIRDFVISASRKGFLGPIPWIISNWNRIVSFVKSIPGKVASGLSRIANIITTPFRNGFNAIIRVATSLPGKILGALSAAGGAIASFGRSIANWLNDATVFGDQVKVGPVSFRIPALAEGGKVSSPTLYVAGDSSKAEWVISQTGNRARNQALVMDAAAALGIPMLANGGKVKDGEIKLAEAELTPGLGDDKAAIQNLINIYAASTGYLGGANSPIKTLTNQKATLEKQIKNAKSRDRKKTLKKRLSAVVEKLDARKDEYLSDLGSLKQYRDQLADLNNEIIGGGDVSGSSAAEQIAAFNQERLSLLMSFGSNIRARSTSPTASTAPASGSATGTSVQINQTYTEPPKDPHAWTRNVQNEITALI